MGSVKKLNKEKKAFVKWLQKGVYKYVSEQIKKLKPLDN